ncbi:transcription repressor OFP13-like [Zingiber officinale]|uniref:Transcription repressor n=1 Tax=Zingiber officinale TaxID=94328 RepID=A0A8J5L9E5_ZINOF|nr:transcription repressor OFP13-like [Zingiber officinale]KAG6509756.1 hypothetical protein ZIOFF_027761 [Zingiber officinale]
MARKVAFASLFFKKRSDISSPPTSTWLWPSCKHPTTDSFRKEDKQCDGNEALYELDSSEPCFSGSSEAECTSFSSESETSSAAEAAVLAVAHGKGSDRLFFEPGRASSLAEEAAEIEKLQQFKGNFATELDSEDPYLDFRLSMEEVVMANGEMKAQWLEEMLCWYLKMNAKSYHGIIVEAFLDLLLTLASSLDLEIDG